MNVLRRALAHPTLIVVALLAILAGYFGATWLWSASVEPPALQRGYEQLKLPSSFRQTAASYRHGSIDVVPSWEYNYAVTGTRRSAYDEIVAALTASGYTVDETSGANHDVMTASGYLTARNPNQHIIVYAHLNPAPNDGYPSDVPLESIDLSEPVVTASITAERY